MSNNKGFWKKGIGSLAIAVVATMASSNIESQVPVKHPDIMGCESQCLVVAGAWPLPYIVDYPALSPVGSVSLSGAALGLDRLDFGSLLVTFSSWLAAILMVAGLYDLGQRRVA